MLGLIIVQLLMVGMFFLFAYLIIKKKVYGLISGFNSKSEEEQQELIHNGYPVASAKGLLHSGVILLIGLLLHFLQFSNAILWSWIVMTIYLFAYLLYISKLEVKRTRKRNNVFLVGTMVFTFGIIGVAFYVGYSENELTVSDKTVQISGVYGVEWSLEELTNIEMVEQLPKVQVRTNGFSLGERLKGRFRLEGMGNGRLFLYRNHPPYLFIEKGEDYLFINSKDNAVTVQWFETVEHAVKR
ncbi:DUF3784 domain-containing protein [Alkalihalobacterium alkalinitrilicum]|uniref:DUF3784 domain-containing protein n=1 Tax=Alkalihalobacterium alkalinitrilicum TaxID=427920 RepID=UPI000995C065|nr:DUF3784 domain-containing protein [Alkalihalobacterium alkalinitrilicum]